jgi:hypothetical protein
MSRWIGKTQGYNFVCENFVKFQVLHELSDPKVGAMVKIDWKQV